MPHLELRETPDGPRYYLEGRELTNGDRVEIQLYPKSDPSLWLRGKFGWNGDPSIPPMVWNQQRGRSVEADCELRWDTHVPLDLPEIKPVVPGPQLKDCERREGV